MFTNPHTIRGRPTLKDVERFRNGSVCELDESARKHVRRLLTFKGRKCVKSTDAKEKGFCKEMCISLYNKRILLSDEHNMRNTEMYVENERDKKVEVFTSTWLLKKSVPRDRSGGQKQMKGNESDVSFVALMIIVMILLMAGIFLGKVSLQIVVLILRMTSRKTRGLLFFVWMLGKQLVHRTLKEMFQYLVKPGDNNVLQ